MGETPSLAQFFNDDSLHAQEMPISIERIAVESKRGCVHLYVKTSHYVCVERKKAIEHAVRNKFFVEHVQLHVKYLHPIDVKTIWDEDRLFFFKEFAKRCPSLYGRLKHADWSVEESVLKVDATKLCEADCRFFTIRDAKKMVTKIFFDCFQVEPILKVNTRGEPHLHTQPIEYEQLKQRIRQKEQKACSLSPQSEHAGKQSEKEHGISRKTKRRMIVGRSFSDSPVPIGEITPLSGRVVILGTVLTFECIQLKNADNKLVKFDVTDDEDTIGCKLFCKPNDQKKLGDALKPGATVKVQGTAVFDTYDRDLCIQAKAIESAPALKRRFDDADKKRVELHAHTKMSAMDGLCDVKDLVAAAERFGHRAVAITDHGVVQAFPNAQEAKAELQSDMKIIYGMEAYLTEDEHTLKEGQSWHVVLLVRNQTGLKNLYRLVSDAHLHYFYKRPHITRELLQSRREGLLVGSACEAGELYRALLEGKAESKIDEILKFYDYLEIQPTKNNAFLVREGMLADEREIENLNRRIVNLGKKHGKMTVATGDVHFIDEKDQVYRKLLMAGQKYKDAELQPPLYYRTTQEMLDEFTYLGDDLAYETVVKNPNAIADMIESIRPIPEGTYTPTIEGAAEQLEHVCYENAYARYGKPLPETIEKRLAKELEAIIGNGFAVMYVIARKLVIQSKKDGYLVGSRGSVGSSFAAHMSDITEVNALPAHYLCPKCRHIEFPNHDDIECGFDLDDQDCQKCGHAMDKDGFDIPFETFMGFGGDKAPDIDLNFAGPYQSVAHKYAESLFGQGQTYRAGTINTLADKTVMGFVRGYYDELEKPLKKAEMNRLIKGCVGVKRTTGQHPGGIVVVPSDYEIYDFCPVQRPADAENSDVITTHFDFNSIHDTILKLDILGHDDPTTIKRLEDLTGISAETLPLNDPKVISLFSGSEALGVSLEAIDCETGTLGLPETGTGFVRNVLMETKPKGVADLIRIMGLTHGTDVWLNNAQDLIRNNGLKLKEVICNRDDIMNDLIKMELDPLSAFLIMESVRKGRGLTKEQEEMMVEKGVPDWYIQSCKRIKYMFPKAHAAAYAMMALRIGWYKVYKKVAFYAAYFSIRGESFDANTMTRGKQEAVQAYRALNSQNRHSMTQKEKETLSLLMLVIEMYERDVCMLPVDLYRSDASDFLIENGMIRPSLQSLNGIGQNAAKSIVKARENVQFSSIDHLRSSANLGKQIIETLQEYGCLKDWPETDQMHII